MDVRAFSAWKSQISTMNGAIVSNFISSAYGMWFERVTSKIDLKTDTREGYLRAVVEDFTPHIVPAAAYCPRVENNGARLEGLSRRERSA